MIVSIGIQTYEKKDFSVAHMSVLTILVIFQFYANRIYMAYLSNL